MASKDNAAQSVGCWISEKVANFAANPFAQIGLIVLCLAWFALGLRVDILTAALSIAAITLTQMVLNKQEEREKDAHRRDVALHAKLDELLHASSKARDELAGIEDLEEEQIEELKDPKIARLPAARRQRRSAK
jgi:low affinity Fe/Cu permease